MALDGRSLTIRVTPGTNKLSVLDVIQRHIKSDTAELSKALDEGTPIQLGRVFTLGHDTTERILSALIETLPAAGATFEILISGRRASLEQFAALIKQWRNTTPTQMLTQLPLYHSAAHDVSIVKRYASEITTYAPAFDKIRRYLFNGLRGQITDWRAQYPTDHWYAFALWSSDDHTYISPGGNSLEYVEQHMAQSKSDQPEQRRTTYRWNTGEWKCLSYLHDSKHESLFHDADAMFKSVPWRFGEEYDENWVDLRDAHLYMAMCYALADLETEGFFGRGNERDVVTLFCSIDDNSDNAWLVPHSAMQLNPPAVFERFINEWVNDPFTRNAEGLKFSNASPSGTRLSFLHLLNQRERNY